MHLHLASERSTRGVWLEFLSLVSFRDSQSRGDSYLDSIIGKTVTHDIAITIITDITKLDGLEGARLSANC